MKKCLILIGLSLLLQSCSSLNLYSQYHDESYQQRQRLGTQGITDSTELSAEQINSMLDSKVVLKEKLNIATLKLSDSWSRTPGFETLYLEILKKSLPKDRVVGITQIPQLLIPYGKVSIDQLRKSAARLQCDLILIYEVQSNVSYHNNLFAKDKNKTYTTAKAYIIDTRTGVIPLTVSIDHKNESVKKYSETSREFSIRAKAESTKKIIEKLSKELTAFLNKNK